MPPGRRKGCMRKYFNLEDGHTDIEKKAMIVSSDRLLHYIGISRGCMFGSTILKVPRKYLLINLYTRKSRDFSTTAKANVKAN